MEVALRRRLAGVAGISISQQHQSAEVDFAPDASMFSPHEFRAALHEADVSVLSFEIDVCGRVEDDDRGSRWFVAGPNRFLLSDQGTATVAALACITAALHDQSGPLRIGQIRALARPPES